MCTIILKDAQMEAVALPAIHFQVSSSAVHWAISLSTDLAKAVDIFVIL
jgi:hypothetical protein